MSEIFFGASCDGGQAPALWVILFRYGTVRYFCKIPVYRYFSVRYKPYIFIPGYFGNCSVFFGISLLVQYYSDQFRKFSQLLELLYICKLPQKHFFFFTIKFQQLKILSKQVRVFFGDELGKCSWWKWMFDTLTAETSFSVFGFMKGKEVSWQLSTTKHVIFSYSCTMLWSTCSTESLDWNGEWNQDL